MAYCDPREPLSTLKKRWGERPEESFNDPVTDKDEKCMYQGQSIEILKSSNVVQACCDQLSTS